MKTIFRLIAFALCAQCFGADAANDIILVQRNSGNTGPVQRNVAPVATGLLGTDGSKVPAPVVVGANLTLSGNPLTLSASASGGAGNRVSDTITQLSHGFSVGQVLYNNNGTFAKAKADAIGTSYALGVVESVTTNTFVIVYQGSITLSGLTTSSLYYLSDATAGAMTTTAPTTTTSFLEPVLRTGTATQAYVDVGSPVSLSKVDLAANVTGFLPSANGGLGVDAHTWTGITDWTSGTPTIHAGVNGRIPIGNTTSGGFDWTTLTQGSGITIANAAGSITITATGSGSGNVTSAASLTANAVVLGSGTQGIETLASLGTSGAPLLSQGSGKPVFGALNLAGGSSIVTGANPVGTGGTGATTLTAHGIVIGNSTGTVNVTAAGTAGQLARSGGASADPGWTTPTFPNTATANKILVGDGTNIVLSTPTFPNASATSGKIIKSDGTNWIASTETYAVPGTSGNIMVSDGTNWTSNATVTYAAHLGTFASPNTAAGAITWTAPVYNIYTSAASTRTYTLPAASSYSGQAFILNVAVGTGHVNVQPASGAALVLAGVLLTADHYVQAATSAPGNYICFTSDGTNWTSLGSSGTWADAASP